MGHIPQSLWPTSGISVPAQQDCICPVCRVRSSDAIIYYERYVVMNPGVKEADGIQKWTFTEEEYLDIIDSLPKGNQVG